eukprot:TRINITY_DN29505_c0_g1_i1.p1 TRINITY_DN29505_c0_g1~~TRINITY_DN29505_c0_g1_i1.p1  ORF type:complete len:215 (+),score=36.24 TRINITY_DN29505_c0_g1_i1:78-722(+)
MSDTVEFLAGYGFRARTWNEWDSAENIAEHPKLAMGVAGHSEIRKHTFYRIRCTLMGELSPVCMAWEASRRLSNFRPLHDALKAHLGKEQYSFYFQGCPFAHRLGPPGTSQRLHKWLQPLCKLLNDCSVSPWMVMRILHFLEVPPPSAGADAQPGFAADESSPRSNTAASRSPESDCIRKLSHPRTMDVCEDLLEFMDDKRIEPVQGSVNNLLD